MKAIGLDAAKVTGWAYKDEHGECRDEDLEQVSGGVSADARFHPDLSADGKLRPVTRGITAKDPDVNYLAI